MTTHHLTLCELQDTGLPHLESWSPFCLKVHRALRAAGLRYTRQCADRPDAWSHYNVTGQVPVLLVDGEPVADSTRILARIETLGGGTLLPADPRLRAEALLWEELADSGLNGFLVAARWADPRNWPTTRDAYFAGMPRVVRAVIPGLLLSVWVATLKEPIRGRADGLPPPLPTPDIWKRFYHDLSSVLPPLTFFHVAQFGPRVLLTNIAIAGGFSALAAIMIAVTGDVPQWVAICLGGYAVSSWSQSLRQRDKPTFALIWGTPTFVFALVGFGLMSFVGYAAGFWAVPYAMRTFVAPMAASGLPVPFYATTGFVALALGGMGAAGGFIGVVVGGWLSDIAKRRNPGGRIIVVSLATLLPLPLFLVMFTKIGRAHV